MTARSIQWLVTIDGCQYGAASRGCPTSITSTDTDFPAGLIVLPGALSSKVRELQWTEEVKPTTAETTISGVSFELDDVVPTSGTASGLDVWTYLFAREIRAAKYALLASTVSSSATSIVVSFDPGFSTGAQVIWIDREAINCSSFNAGTKTFTVATSGRGYLGTKAVEHAVDAGNAFYPAVFDSFVNPQKRRTILWRIEDGVATPVYRGYLGRAPRLLDGDTGRWEIQVDHALTAQMARPLGPSRTAVTVMGYQPETVQLFLARLGASGAVAQFWSVMTEPYTGTLPETVEDLGAILVDALNEQMALASTSPFSATVRATYAGDSLRFECSANAQHMLTVAPADINRIDYAPDATRRRDGRSQSTEQSTGVWDSFVYFYPARAHVVLRGGLGGSFPVDSTTGLPSTLVTSVTDGAITTSLQYVLTGEDFREIPYHVVLTAVDSGTRRLSGILRRSGLDVSRPVALYGRENLLLTEPTTLRLAVRASSSHWIRALQRGVFSSGFGVDEQADDRDWSWATASEVISATGGEYATARSWVFDGSQRLGEFFSDVLRMDACAIVTRGSRLSILPFGPPLDSDTPDATIDLSSNTLHRSKPGYTTLPEGIVNVLRLKREAGPSITVQNQQSIALYGLAPAVEVEAKGALLTLVQNQTPFELARGMFSRVLGMWGEPAELLRVDATIEQMDALELGKTVAITSASLPDGQGARRTLTTRRGRVVARTVSLAGTVQAAVLVHPQRAVGYSPAVRVDAISGTELQIATSYLSATTLDDYAGSNADDYTGTISDGGCSKFSVGDVVRFRIEGVSTSSTEGGFTIVSIDAASRFIELDIDPSSGSIDWTAEVGAGEIVVLTFDTYDVVTQTQRQWGYVGSRVTRDLDGDPIQEWAP